MQTIAIFGYGNVGRKLAALFSAADKNIIICSRNGNSGADLYQATDFLQGAREADAIALAIPYSSAAELLRPLAAELTDKTIIDCTNPLNDDWSPLLLGQETSAAEQLAEACPQANIVKAFNTIFADVMTPECITQYPQPMTAFIAGNDPASKQNVIDLATATGMAPVDTGPLKTSRYLEAMAHLNIQIAVGQGGGTGAAFCYTPVGA